MYMSIPANSPAQSCSHPLTQLLTNASRIYLWLDPTTTVTFSSPFPHTLFSIYASRCLQTCNTQSGTPKKKASFHSLHSTRLPSFYIGATRIAVTTLMP